MDGVPAPVAYIDREERCHYVNRTFLQFFGLTEHGEAVFTRIPSFQMQTPRVG